ncbi:MAG: permease [Candidatus Peribacteraceae bacterium]|jgi:hypothetical protein
MLDAAASFVVTTVGIPLESHLGAAIHFFIADILKIFLLLIAIVFTVSVLRTFLPPERIRRFLSGRRMTGHLFAGLFGIVTPFCTCSAIPLFLGFLEAGVPLSVTFTFLVASPMINEVALVMLLGLFGWRVTLLYIGSGLLIAILAGLFLGSLKAETLLLPLSREGVDRKFAQQWNTWEDRLTYARNYTLMIFRRVWLYIVIGVGIGAGIHGYVPQDFLASVAGEGNPFAVIVAVLIGIPLYSNAAGIMPLVSVLTEKGVAIGTVLAFMMAVTGLSLPEFLILRRVMKLKLLFLFFGTVGAGIIITGYLFNAIL